MDVDKFVRLMKNTDPLPLTFGEFAAHAEIDRRVVEELIASGEIKTVVTNRGEQIPFSAFETFMTKISRENIERVRAIFVGLAVALQTGIAVERRFDDAGCVVYQRTTKPLSEA